MFVSPGVVLREGDALKHGPEPPEDPLHMSRREFNVRSFPFVRCARHLLSKVSRSVAVASNNVGGRPTRVRAAG